MIPALLNLKVTPEGVTLLSHNGGPWTPSDKVPFHMVGGNLFLGSDMVVSSPEDYIRLSRNKHGEPQLLTVNGLVAWEAAC